MQEVLHSFAYSLDYLREQVAGVSDADLTRQPAGVPNHPAWVIGHLTLTCQMIAGAVADAPPWLPEHFQSLYGAGSTPVNANRYGRKDEALARLAEAQQRITHIVRALAPKQLDKPFPDPAYIYVFPTLRHAITQVLVGHTAFHVGQVAAWRRAMGLPAMRRAFE